MYYLKYSYYCKRENQIKNNVKKVEAWVLGRLKKRLMTFFIYLPNYCATSRYVGSNKQKDNNNNIFIKKSKRYVSLTRTSTLK